MKRDLKINYGQLRYTKEKIDRYIQALEDLKTASNRFQAAIANQESLAYDEI